MDLPDVLKFLLALAAYFAVLAAGIGLAWLTHRQGGRRG